MNEFVLFPAFDPKRQSFVVVVVVVVESHWLTKLCFDVWNLHNISCTVLVQLTA